MPDLSSQLPRDLAQRTKFARLGPPSNQVPVLLAHPDWQTPAPTVLWMHGRTANKELDPGRYLRWVRAGIAACAIDLPGHGERFDPALQQPDRTLDVLSQMVGELDHIVEALADPHWAHAGRSLFDLDRLALGGMSAGGMATLRRLCDDHPFVAASVEGSTGWLAGLYLPQNYPNLVESPGIKRWAVTHDPAKVAELDPFDRIATFRPIPLLALHSQADEMVPWPVQEAFLNALRRQYSTQGADPDLISIRTWPRTGAPQEHVGFGQVSNDAKNIQTNFFRKAFHFPEP
jgi:fermentation-respiration switch protein FrsA (DUF1100 family)